MNKEKIKEITYNQDLPQIIYEKKRSCVGMETESEYISVKAKTIKEAKEIFDKIKKDE